MSHPSHHSSAAHPQSSRRSYLIGFLLSVLLTAVPFWLVMTGALGNPRDTAILVVAFAFVQIVVHMVYFLHLDSKSEGGWTMMATIFTLVLVAITLTGSIWVMLHMNANMMPAGGSSMSSMP